MSQERFLHIKDEEVLSDKQVLHMVEIIPSYEGWHSIEENFWAKLNNGKYFYVIEEEFDFH